jgi:tetratricopeptide (TPR) repeat protein
MNAQELPSSLLPEAAIARLRQAIQADPVDADLHNNLGVFLTHTGCLGDAVACYRQALRLRPHFADAWNNLSYVLCGLGQVEEARGCAEQALLLRPHFAEASNHLGLALLELGRHQEAAEQFQKALRLQPRFAQARHNLGKAFEEQGRLAEALVCFEQTLQLQPGLPEPHVALADVLKKLGQFEQAVGQLRQALRLKPEEALAYCYLSQFASHGWYLFSEAEVGCVRALLKNDRLTLLQRSLLHLTLGNVLDRQEAFDEAFCHFTQAGALRKEWLRQIGQAFDPAAHRALIDGLIATFDEAFFQHQRPPISASELPVFIIGMPRSATTLVEQILSSHPQVAGAGELRDLPQLVASLAKRGQDGSGYPMCMPAVPVQDFRVAAEKYLAHLTRIGGGAIRVVDKMCEHFLHLGVIALAFPRARIIHCRRNPLDICLSCFFENFKGVNYSWALEDLAVYYREYERLMAHWQRCLPLEVWEVRYEDLVSRQEKVSRELIAFCGLPWTDRCLAFHENPRPVHTASAVQVRRPLYTRSIGRWQNYAAHLGPLRDALQATK